MMTTATRRCSRRRETSMSDCTYPDPTANKAVAEIERQGIYGWGDRREAARRRAVQSRDRRLKAARVLNPGAQPEPLLHCLGCNRVRSWFPLYAGVHVRATGRPCGVVEVV